jgi:hypothetical protein
MDSTRHPIKYVHFINKTCSDIDECEDKTLNKCNHICQNMDGAYTCDCNQGNQARMTWVI